MSVPANEDFASNFNRTEKEREDDYWGKLEGDTDFDLPPEAHDETDRACSTGAQSCAAGSQAATCNQSLADIDLGQVQLEPIQNGMEVIASCGNRIGKVDHLDGDDSIKLMKHDSQADGQHHWIPTSWVDHVDEHVHLNVNSQEAMNRWKSEEECEACSQ